MSAMTRSIRYAALVVALAAMLGACGSPYKGLTKAEFVRRASRSCDHPSKAGEAARKLVAVQSVPARKAKVYLQRVLPLLERELDRISALKPPKADRDRVKKIIDQAREDTKNFAKRLKEDPAAALSRLEQPFAKSFKAANRYGVKICVA